MMIKPVCAAVILIVAFLAVPASAQTQTGSGRAMEPSRCDEFRAAWQAARAGERYVGKLSMKFVAQLNAYMASHCTRPLVFDFDASKQDTAALQDIMHRL
jgi:hypothetical protein